MHAVVEESDVSAKQRESECASAVHDQRPGARCGSREVGGSTNRGGDDGDELEEEGRNSP